MKALYGFFAGLGVFGILASFALAFGLFFVSIYGIYLAFSASILLGILALFAEPAPLVFGLVALFTGTDLPVKIVQWFHTL